MFFNEMISVLLTNHEYTFACISLSWEYIYNDMLYFVSLWHLSPYKNSYPYNINIGRNIGTSHVNITQFTTGVCLQADIAGLNIP